MERDRRVPGQPSQIERVDEIVDGENYCEGQSGDQTGFDAGSDKQLNLSGQGDGQNQPRLRYVGDESQPGIERIDRRRVEP